MPDRTNKVRIRFPDPEKHLKSGIIQDRVEVVAILICSSKWRLPRVRHYCRPQKSKQYGLNMSN